jgi:hypothetical protein
VIALAVTSGSAQNPAPKPQENPEREKPLVRVNVDLVQMDVVVTGAKGNHGADLKPEEFEILENGKPQRITNFSFLAGEEVARVAVTPAPAVKDKRTPAPPVAPVPVAPGQANRTMVVLIDDLGMSQQSYMDVRAALEKFIDQTGNHPCKSDQIPHVNAVNSRPSFPHSPAPLFQRKQIPLPHFIARGSRWNRSSIRASGGVRRRGGVAGIDWFRKPPKALNRFQ